MWKSYSHWGMFRILSNNWRELPLNPKIFKNRAWQNFYGWGGDFDKTAAGD